MTVRVTYIAGDPATGKTSIGMAIEALNNHLGHNCILIDEGRSYTKYPASEVYTPARLVAAVARYREAKETLTVILVGAATKPHLDAMLSVLPSMDYQFIVTSVHKNG